MRWAEHVASTEDGRNVYRVLIWRSESRRLLRRPRSRWEDNIKMEIRDTVVDGVTWIRLAQES
jgi:hypothetical protein